MRVATILLLIVAALLLWKMFGQSPAVVSTVANPPKDNPPPSAGSQDSFARVADLLADITRRVTEAFNTNNATAQINEMSGS